MVLLKAKVSGLLEKKAKIVEAVKVNTPLKRGKLLRLQHTRIWNLKIAIACKMPIFYQYKEILLF